MTYQITPNSLDNAKALSAYTDADVVVFNKDKLGDFNTKILILIRLYFILTILITENDRNHIVFD
jgi:hypothetical protein